MPIFKKRIFFTFAFLLPVVIVGAFLRFINISQFKFYPDAYQSLMVSENIRNYQSVVGQLGKDGMFYPDFFMWTRPVFPLLINFTNSFVSDPVKSAYLVVIFTSILSILLMFLLNYQIFKSKLLGFFGSLLIAVSFNHAVWSGFIYTESPAIFINLIFLNLLIWRLDQAVKLGDIRDFFTGVAFSLAVFSRYEYSVLLIPAAFLIYNLNPKPVIKLSNITLGFTLTGILILTQLYFLPSLINIITTQLSAYYLEGSIFLGILIIIFGLKKYLKSGDTSYFKYFNNLVFFIIEMVVFLSILQSFWGEKIVGFFQFSAMRDFFKFDFLLGILSLLGIKFILKDEKYKHFGYFGLMTIFLLWPIYNKVNPEMQRYWTHFIPVLVIISAYGVSRIVKSKWRTFGLAVLLILLIAQVFVTYKGIKNWDNGDWFRLSYEEKSANLLKDKLMTNEKDDKFLIASFPESYYFFTRVPTHSLTAEPPFLYIDRTLNDKTFLIIEDMGMRELFPKFSQFLHSNLQDKKIREYFVGETYHWSITSKKEIFPVVIYQIKLGDLKARIEEAQL